MMRWSQLYALLVLSLLLSSCGILRRKTITTTETITRLDTVIIIRRDTITKEIRGEIHDTLRLENIMSVAKTYYDTTNKKMVLSLRGKTFAVPLSIYKKEVTTESIKETKRPNRLFWFITVWLIVVTFILLIWKKIFGK